jgi:predicted tellurium resistance membrane protein TerC
MLALSFLILIGIMLIAEATGAHVDKGYLYFGIAFSLGVELLNMRFRKKHTPVQLHGTLEDAQNEDENVEGFMEEKP